MIRKSLVFNTLVLLLFGNILYAQTDGSNNSLLKVPPGGVVIGDSLPELFWQQELQVVNDRYGRKTVKLSAFKHQLLILDFLNTACVPCIASVDKWNELQPEFRSEVAVLPIHLYGDNNRIASFAEERRWTMPIATGNHADTLINMLFYVHKSFGQVWIMDDKLLAIPHNRDVSKALIGRALTRRSLAIEMNDRLTYFDQRYFPN